MVFGTRVNFTAVKLFNMLWTSFPCDLSKRKSSY